MNKLTVLSQNWRNIKLKRFTLSAILLTVILYFIHSYSVNPKYDYARVSHRAHALSEIKSSADFFALSDITFPSEILSQISFKEFRGDSLFYWNNVQDFTSENSEYLPLSHSYGGGDMSSTVNFPFYHKESRKLHPIFSHLLEHTFTVTSDQTELSFDHFDLNEPHYLGVLEFQPAQWKLVGFFLLFTLSFISIIRLIAESLGPRNTIRNSLIFGMATLGLRVILYYICHYSLLDKFRLFSDVNYFNKLTCSVGDLFFNIILIGCWVYFMYRNDRNTRPLLKSYFIAIPLVSGISLCYLYIINISDKIINSQDLAINVERVMSFDKYGIFILSLLISLTLLGFIYHIFIAKKLQSHFADWKKKLAIYVIASVLVLPLWLHLDYLREFLLCNLFLIGLSLLIDIFIDGERRSVVWLIWWIIVFSAFMATVLFGFGIKKRLADRNEFVQSLYKSPDSGIIKSFNSLKKDTSYYKLLQNILTLPTNADVEREDLVEYLLRHKVFRSLVEEKSWDIHLFDEYGASVLKNDFITEDRLRESQGWPIPLGQDINFDGLTGQYQIAFRSNRKGFSSPITIYVVLEGNELHNEKNISYSIYNGYKCLLKHKNEDHSETEKYTAYPAGQTIENGQAVIVHIPIKGIKIISAEPIAKLIKPISLFSYLFYLTGLITVLVILGFRALNLNNPLLNINLESLQSLRSKIQFWVVALIVLSFGLIGIITVFYFNNEIQKDIYTKLDDRTESLIRDVDTRLSIGIDNTSRQAILQNNLVALSQIHGVDLSLFSANGEILYSTCEKADARLPYALAVSDLSNEWRRLASPRETTIQYFIGLPQANTYLRADHEARNISFSKIDDFISTILNVYVFLFLLAGAIAISISNGITSPLISLSEKIKLLKLGKKNESLEWHRKDEIGALIDTYNDMLVQLDQSANMLAKTERDLAWREMAKQVAHEIKNPLTPMKLSIQYLEKAIGSQPERAATLIEKVSATLIEQIDNLAQIANEFSNFAKMPQAKNERIILNEIVETVHDLFRKREDMDILLEEPITDLIIFADHNHLVRILNNILKNSIQAIPDQRKGLIKIRLWAESKNAIISIQDNGKGIPDEMKDKVFTPNFTTKSSGTGLGLAISANMIESFNGKIWFDSTEGMGTTFYVEIPLMHINENMEPQNNRVSLDD